MKVPSFADIGKQANGEPHVARKVAVASLSLLQLGTSHRACTCRSALRLRLKGRVPI